MESESTLTQSTLAEKFAAFSTGLQYDDLPVDVVHEVKRRVLDSLGCALGAWYAEPCVIARKVAGRMSSQPGSSVIGTSHRAPPDWAAFANGCMVRYLDFNDTYLSKEPAHPSDNIPAALAVAEAEKSPGQQVIAAIALAYEVQCRLCDAACIRFKGWDHVTYGTFSTALAASRLMNLSTAQTRHAVGIAGVASANLRQSRVGELSHWKGCAFAGAARQGVFAAMLARDGMTGPAPIFEGTNGFEKLISGPLSLKGPFGNNPAPFNENDFMILKTSIKHWPAEYHAQSAIEAALELRRQIPSMDFVESIHIESHDAAVDIIGTGAERWRPTSRETADHSLPYLTGVALMDGEVTDKQFQLSRYTDEKLLKLISKITVARHGELCQRYPVQVGNMVTIKLKDGRLLSKRVDSPLGSAHHPLSDDQVEEKFHNLADPVIGVQRAGQLAWWVWRLEEMKTVEDLFPLTPVHQS